MFGGLFYLVNCVFCFVFMVFTRGFLWFVCFAICGFCLRLLFVGVIG